MCGAWVQMQTVADTVADTARPANRIPSPEPGHILCTILLTSHSQWLP